MTADERGGIQHDDVLPTGTRIGQYEIQALIGRGGMAAVYRALQTTLDRPVALKVMAPLLSTQPSFKQRFLKEAQTVARLNHPNIVTVHDFGEASMRHYLAMEYVSGGDLKSRINSEPIQPRQALVVLREMAGALAYAHKKGFVHRDVKPENILFHEDGQATLSDFGIALAVESTTRMTGTGTSIGTPHYMSPEQGQGEHDLDARSDLYSLGIVFYEMLTGKVPYDAANTIGIVIKHVREPVPKLSSQLAKYQAILDGLLVKDRKNRFSSAQDLIGAIDHIGQEQHWRAPRRSLVPERTAVIQAPSKPKYSQRRSARQSPRKSQQSSSKGVIWAICGAVLAAVAALSVWFASQSQQFKPTGGFSSPIASSTSNSNPMSERALTPSQQSARDVDTTSTSPLEEQLAQSRTGIRVNPNPATASVYVDGAIAGRGSLELTDLKGGESVTIRAEADGYEPLEQVVRVPSDRIMQMSMTLQKVIPKYALTIQPNPPDATVRILNIGPRYQRGILLEAGNYHVEVSKNGYETKRLWLTLSNQHLTTQIVLNKERVRQVRETDERHREFVASKPTVDFHTASEKAKLSYSVGWDIGQDIVRSSEGFELEHLTDGIRDIVNRTSPRISESEMKRLLTSLQNRMREKSSGTGPKSERIALSYAVGWDIGADIRRRSREFDVNDIVTGIQDAVWERKPRVSPHEMKTLLVALQEQVRSEQVEQFQSLSEENAAKSKAFLAANKFRTGIVVLPSGVQYRIIEEGRGRRPKLINNVVLHYRGSKIDGLEFDSSFARGTPEEFTINKSLIGWQQVLPLMKEGATWQIFVPSELAFGARGNPPVGPNEALIFDLKLIDIRR